MYAFFDGVYNIFRGQRRYRENSKVKVKVKASHTRYRVLGPKLIPVYRQSACR